MKKRVLATLLALCLGIGLVPTTALAEGSEYTKEVSSAEDLAAAVNEINADASGTGNYVISLRADITCDRLSFQNNTTTIVGNGHTIDLGKVANNISVNGGRSNHPVLILGKNDDAENTLTIRSNGSYGSVGDHFIVVGEPGNGVGCGTLKMHSGVTITGAVTNNTFGGAVVVGRGGTFEMNGGLITKCGVDGGSVCFGGGVAVINGGVFIMSGGSIRDCFLNTEYSEKTPTYYNLFFNYGAGAGVFVANGSTFRMTGGTIANNRICKKEGSNYESYGVGGGIAILAVYNDYSVASRVEITGGSIESNYATMGGGGIAICGMRPMSGAIASPYTPPAGSPEDAAGLYIRGTADSKVQIKNNSAGGWGDYAVGGGGILVYHLKDTNAVDIQNAEITGNSVANGPGGGIESLRLSSGYQNNLSVKDCTIKDNRALWGGGICMFNSSRDSVMSTTTEGIVITENTAFGDLGGGISIEGASQLTFNAGCAIYDNTANVGADDIYKDADAVMTGLPTAEQMRGAVPGLNLSGWYWDYKTVNDGATYEYPEGTEHPCARYSDTNAVAYTPIPSELAERYLKAVKVSTYTVSFDAQGGTKVDSQTVPSGGTASKPENPTRENYVFDTWKLGEEVYNFDTPVTADITLTAVWKEDRNNNGVADEEEPKYTVIYTDGIEGIEIFADQKTENLLPGAATPTFQGTPSRPGYTFTGWSPEVAETVTADVTYVAQWHKNGGTTIRYTLTYETNGGNEIPSTTHAKNSVVSLDKVPVRENYTFTGWYEDEELTKKITEITMTSDKAVYAGWEATVVPGMLNGDDHFAYVIGYPDGSVKPMGNITRAEVATIFFRLLKDDVRDGSLTTTNVFNDVNEGDWFNTAVSAMAKLGIVNGRTADTFVPGAPITRAEFAAICARFDTSIDMGASSFTDIDGHWAKDDIEHAVSLGWIMGYEDSTFRPNNLITRAEAMTMINRVLCRMPEVPEDLLSDMNVWPDNSDTSKWYYLAVQEGTNSHDFKMKSEIYETWTELTADPDWSRYQN